MRARLAMVLTLTAGLASCSADTGPKSESTGCRYDGATHAAGETFPASDGCNTCSCDPSGQVMCTKKLCDGGTDVPTTGCAIAGGLVFGYQGGMVVYQDDFALDERGALTVTRTYYGRSAVDGAAVRSCAPAMSPCAAAAVAPIADDLAVADVAAAFVPQTTKLYGVDERPADGPLWSMTRSGQAIVQVGAPCASSSATCTPIPAGVQKLAGDLQKLATAALAAPECAGL